MQKNRCNGTIWHFLPVSSGASFPGNREIPPENRNARDSIYGEFVVILLRENEILHHANEILHSGKI